VTDSNSRNHTTAQVVFAVSRTLVLGRLLWGDRGGIALDGLPPVVGVSALHVERAVEYLCRHGLAELDGERARVGLTVQGWHELAGVSGSGAA